MLYTIFSFDFINILAASVPRCVNNLAQTVQIQSQDKHLIRFVEIYCSKLELFNLFTISKVSKLFNKRYRSNEITLNKIFAKANQAFVIKQQFINFRTLANHCSE